MRLGSVIALNTTSRGASNSRVIRISLSEGSVTFVVVLLAVAMVFLSLCFMLAKDVVEAIESFVDRAAVTLQPGVELVERFRAQAVDPLLRHRMDLDEPGIAKNTQMLRDLGLPEPEPHSDLPDRRRPWVQVRRYRLRRLVGAGRAPGE